MEQQIDTTKSTPSSFRDMAGKLASLYKSRATALADEWLAEQDMDIRKSELTPAEGWQGKNDTERKTAKDKTFGADAQLKAIEDKYRKAHMDVMKLDAEIAGAEAERRAEEWEVRKVFSEKVGWKTDEPKAEVMDQVVDEPMDFDENFNDPRDQFNFGNGEIPF